MEILRSGFQSVLGGGGGGGGETPTPADTIERLVDRLVSSTLLVRNLFHKSLVPLSGGELPKNNTDFGHSQMEESAMCRKTRPQKSGLWHCFICEKML